MKLKINKKEQEKKIKSRSKKADDKQKTILEMLKSHGAKIYDDLDNFSKASGELSDLQWVDINYLHTLELPKITKIVVGYLRELIISNYNYAYVPFYSGGSNGLDRKRLEF